MTHEEHVRQVWADKVGIAYYNKVRDLHISDFLTWWEDSTASEIYRAMDPVIYSNRPKELADCTGLSLQLIYALRKKCHRNRKPSFETVVRIMSCGVCS